MNFAIPSYLACHLICELYQAILFVGVIGHGYPEDGKTIFQDIGASKAPQSDCPAAPAGSPSDCSARPAADCADQPATDCSPSGHRQDPDEMAIPRTRQLYLDAIMYSVTCPLALFMK